MPVYLVNTSFVFIVEVSNPAYFTADYLMEVGVFPEELRIMTDVALPHTSSITYNDEYTFQALEQRVTLEREIMLPEDAADRVSNVDDLKISGYLQNAAMKLVEGLKLFRLESVGTNFRVFAANTNLSRFIQSFPDDAFTSAIRFARLSEGVQVNYSMTTAAVADKNPPLTGVLLDINFDGQIQDKSDDSRRAEQIAALVSRSNEFFESMKGTLNVLNF